MESESRPYIVAVPVPLPQAEDSNTTPAVPSPDPTGIHVMMTSKLPSVAAPPAERTLAPLPDVSIDPPSPPFILNSLASPAVLQPATTSRFAGEFAFIDQTPGAAQVQDMSQPFFTQAPLFLQPGAQSQVTNIPTTQSATIPTSVTITSMSSTSLNLSGHSSTAAFVGNSPAIAMLDPATLPVSSQNQQAAAQAGVYLPIPFLASIIAVVIFGAIGIFLYRQRKQVIEAESKNAVWSAPLPYRRRKFEEGFTERVEMRVDANRSTEGGASPYSETTEVTMISDTARSPRNLPPLRVASHQLPSPVDQLTFSEITPVSATFMPREPEVFDADITRKPGGVRFNEEESELVTFQPHYPRSITVNTQAITEKPGNFNASISAASAIAVTKLAKSPTSPGWLLVSPLTIEPPTTTPIGPSTQPKYLEHLDEEAAVGAFDYAYAQLSRTLFATPAIPEHNKVAERKKIEPDSEHSSNDTLIITTLPREFLPLGAEPIKQLPSTEHEFLEAGSAKSYIQKSTLRFKSYKMENEYLFDILLPIKVVFSRLGTAVVGIYTICLLIWFLAVQGNAAGIWNYVILSVIIAACSVQFFLASWKNGGYFIRLYIVLLASILGYDFISSSQPGDALGSVSNTVIACSFLTSGLSSTFIERLLLFAVLLVIIAIKASFVFIDGGAIQMIIYLLPIVATCLLMFDSVYVGDMDRRTKMINTKIVQARLKGLQEGCQKTEYLLSLTLPSTIVNKLKEVGTGNFDLIAERFDMTSVMFADIKNFKDLAHSISQKSAITLLNTIFHHMDEIRSGFRNLERIKTINSKLLIVGGLEKNEQIDDLLELIDMALAYKSVFENEVEFESMNLKLEIAMGVHIGPLVAGIVGKKTFCYEVYGDVVNTASRMLGIAGPGQIVVTSAVWDRISKEYTGQLIGAKQVKGKGLMNVYSVEQRKVLAEPDIPAARIRNTRHRSSIQFTSARESVVMVPRTARINTQILEQAYTAAVSVATSSGPSPDALGTSVSSLRQGSINIMDKRDSEATIIQVSRDPQIGSPSIALPQIHESEESIHQSILSKADGLKSPKSVNFSFDLIESPPSQVEKLPGNESESHRASVSSQILPPKGSSFLDIAGDPTTERRWSSLGFGRNPLQIPILNRIKLNNEKSSFESLKRSKDKVNEVLDVRQVIKRLSSVRSSRRKSMEIAASWPQEDIALPIERVNEAMSMADSIKRDSLEDLMIEETSQEEVKKMRQSFSDQTVKAKYVLLLAAIAYVGGYKEGLSPEEHEVLNHTGAVKFLMDDRCMDAVHNSMNPFLRFISGDLEKRYMFDLNHKLGQNFWGTSVKGIFGQGVIVTLAFLNLYAVLNSTLEATNQAVGLIVVIFIATGGQTLVTAVLSAPVQTTLNPRSRLVVGIFSTLALFTIAVMASFPWSGLTAYSLLVPIVLPQFTMIHAFSLEGVSYANKIIIVIFFNLVFLVVNRDTHISFAPLVLMIPYMVIYHIRETTVKSDYLMGLIGVTQASLVKEEVTKSALVLTTILPKRIITKLLVDPTSMFYEEFSMITVLHMDIAGFTAMSTRLEPLDIVKIFNNLFTYFDRLISDFRIEKITTIGDAYVASSNLSTNAADPRTSAICVALVALQMQAFVVDQVNETYLMKHKHQQTISMRIGLNSGPCYGAIMGGDKNFRYDLMGETVVNAEKIQEHCEIGKVFISESTNNLVQDYHAFKIEKVDIEVGGKLVYALSTD
ncbi:hypothetical protein BC830DRAFT_1214717 [Chytriomyces sp. MP71]|nr:hypothetical protein BC830DRAFT_1214717 [Chytriomyces sp. MP71]